MKIKKVNELTENEIIEANDAKNKLKDLLYDVWLDGFVAGGDNERDERFEDFDMFWGENGDKILIDFKK